VKVVVDVDALDEVAVVVLDDDDDVEVVGVEVKAVACRNVINPPSIDYSRHSPFRRAPSMAVAVHKWTEARTTAGW
jgi:hypothetical protein